MSDIVVNISLPAAISLLLVWCHTLSANISAVALPLDGLGNSICNSLIDLHWY